MPNKDDAQADDEEENGRPAYFLARQEIQARGHAIIVLPLAGKGNLASCIQRTAVLKWRLKKIIARKKEVQDEE
ncbi:MAG TPA: hypothetical protein VLQ89_03100 [Candidatus Binatia bacterium]|nr:hypothetical protein [Candidatus Binatia bacterium]